jgi:hypothetical protein
MYECHSAAVYSMQVEYFLTPYPSRMRTFEHSSRQLPTLEDHLHFAAKRSLESEFPSPKVLRKSLSCSFRRIRGESQFTTTSVLRCPNDFKRPKSEPLPLLSPISKVFGSAGFEEMGSHDVNHSREQDLCLGCDILTAFFGWNG